VGGEAEAEAEAEAVRAVEEVVCIAELGEIVAEGVCIAELGDIVGEAVCTAELMGEIVGEGFRVGVGVFAGAGGTDPDVGGDHENCSSQSDFHDLSNCGSTHWRVLSPCHCDGGPSCMDATSLSRLHVWLPVPQYISTVLCVDLKSLKSRTTGPMRWPRAVFSGQRVLMQVSIW
jgi:hypothetical protein